MPKNQLIPIESTIEGFLKPLSPTLSKYKARNYEMDKFLRSANLAIMGSDDLQKAVQTDAGKKSLLDALRYASSTGLSLNPQEGKACLIAYKDKVQYQIMKNGLVQLALETGNVEFITGEIVRENDNFRITKNMDGDNYNHEIALQERGKLIGFYSAMKLKDGGRHVIYMSHQEMTEHRERYAKGLRYTYTKKEWGQVKGELKKDHAWVKSFEGQGIKTVIKRLLSRIAIEEDKDFEKLIASDMVEQPEPETIGDRFDEAVPEVKPDIIGVETEVKAYSPEKVEPKDVTPEPKKKTDATEDELDIF